MKALRRFHLGALVSVVFVVGTAAPAAAVAASAPIPTVTPTPFPGLSALPPGAQPGTGTAVTSFPGLPALSPGTQPGSGITNPETSASYNIESASCPGFPDEVCYAIFNVGGGPFTVVFAFEGYDGYIQITRSANCNQSSCTEEWGGYPTPNYDTALGVTVGGNNVRGLETV